MVGHGFDLLALPVNMTDIRSLLHVARLRQANARFEWRCCIRTTRSLYKTQEAAQRVSADAEQPLYALPVPSLATYIAVQSKVFAVNFATPEFAASIVPCFKMWA